MYRLLVTYKFENQKNRDGFLEAVTEDKIAQCTMKEDGCIRYEYEIPDSSTILLLHEEWRDKAAQEAHTHNTTMSRIKAYKVRFSAETNIEELEVDAADKTFMDLALERYSVRSFKSTPVEQEKIDAILKAARIAPTARNSQPQKIYVLKSEEAIRKINDNCRCIYGAPLVFAIGYDKSRICGVDEDRVYGFGEIDSTIVTTHMILEATEQGLGSCWVGLFHDADVREALGISDEVRITSLLPVGYAADDCVPADRHTEYRSDEEVVEYL